MDTNYNKLLEMWRDEKKKRPEAKGEMKALKKEVEELKAELARAKEEHQYDNLVHKKELEDLKKYKWSPRLDGSGR